MNKERQRVYREIASKLQAIRNCEQSGNKEWKVKHADAIKRIVDNYLPTGSGFDNGTWFDFKRSEPDKLVFDTSFHHMDENGFYDGWTTHVVTVRPSLAFGFRLSISGRDRNDIKDYIAGEFEQALNEGVDNAVIYPDNGSTVATPA